MKTGFFNTKEAALADTKETGKQPARRFLMPLWASLFVLVVSDGVVTEHLISQRFAWEFNPLLSIWVGNPGFLLLKAVGSLVAIFILWDISRRSYRLAMAVSCCLVLLYTVIVFWNLSLYLIAWL